jgi:hypothetical protein
MFGRKKISPFLSDHKSDVDPIPTRKPIALNPLAMFPSKSDSLSVGLFSVSLTVPSKLRTAAPARQVPLDSPSKDDLDDQEGDAKDPQWLLPDKIDPEFGLQVILTSLSSISLLSY